MSVAKGFWVGVALLCAAASPAAAFPPQSIELMPGYKTPDSTSNGAFTGQIRYFVHFPSYYLATGIGIGQISAEANHKNLAIGSDIEMNPVTFAVRLTPPHPDWLPFYLEAGINRLAGLSYRLDPSVNVGADDFCTTDISAGPLECQITTLKKRSVGYHVGAGLEIVARSGFGIGLHYMYLFARPIERTVEESEALGVLPSTVTREELFKINMSIVSLVFSYHF